MAKNFEANVKRWSLFAPREAAELLTMDCSHLSFCNAENGELNLKNERNPEAYFLHSQKSPTHEAKKWFSELSLRNVHIIYVYGVGLGYYYEAAWEWLREDQRRSLIFFEDDLEVIHRLLETPTGTNILHDHQVTLRFYGESPESGSLDAFLANFSLYEYVSTTLESYAKYRPVEVNKIKSHIAFFSVLHKTTTFEYSLHGKSFFNNFFRNLLYLPQSHLANSLYGKFNGIPAIICGAGPSLEKNINTLKQLSDRALIFAGGTALNALNVQGVMPHFGVGIDPNPDHFTRLIMNQAYETPFFYRNRMLHEAFQMIHGDKLYVTGAGGYKVSEWFEKNLGIEVRDLDEGCNVLNFSLSIAHAMGCHPIIFVGVDLAYSQGRSYAPGLISHPIHDRKNNFRTKLAFEEILPKFDIYGEPIYTLWKWVAEAIWYSRYASSHSDVLMINATEGGIGFPGVINATLEGVRQRFLTKSYDFSALVHGEIQNGSLPPCVTTEKVEELMLELSEGLHRCWLHCHAIYSELDAALAGSNQKTKVDFEAIWAKKKEAEEKLFAEPAYDYFLKVFNDAYLRAYGFEALRLIYDEGLVPREEIELKKMKLDSLRFHFLKQTALINSSLIQEVISEYFELEKSTENWIKISKENQEKLKGKVSHSVEHQTDEKYEITDDALIIQDPELNLSINVPFNPREGKQVLYHLNGSVKVEQYYHNNLLHGPSTFFSEEGKVLAKNWFVYGEKQGKAWSYYLTGELYSKQCFRHGKWEGKQQYFYRDGFPKTLLIYKNGQLDGNILLYYPGGRPERSLNFINGKRNGMERNWDEKGLVIIEAEYRDDRPIGAARRWHSNGNLAKEILYDEQSNRCLIRMWNSAGVPIEQEELYEDDYFDKVAKHTGQLTESLDEVFNHLNKVVPILSSKINEQREESQPKLNFQKEFDEIKEKLKHLHELGEELKVESNLNAGNALEPLWKNPSTQQEIEKQLENVKSVLAKETKDIEKGLKDILGGIFQKVKEQPPKPIEPKEE